MSKTRLAPINEKQLTIPRLELQAAALGCRIRSVIVEETKCEFKAVYLWMDSKIVINYIKNKTTNFGVFIAHRINEIRNNSTVNEWHYVSTRDNIADDLTRYKGFDSLQKASRWCNGPDFLYNSLENHEIISVNTMSTKDKDKTFRRASNNGQSTVLHTAELNREITSQKVFINWSRYSSLTKLVRHLAWTLKLKTNWLKWKKGSSERINFNFFTPSEIATSKSVLCEIAQKESYPSEYHALSNKKPVQKNSKIISLNPVFKDLVKLGGRIHHADVPENAKHQVILAKDHPLSLLVIQNIHEEIFM